MKWAIALALVVAACASDDDIRVPVKVAPASRHDALRDALLADSATGDRSTGSAIAYLAHSTPVAPARIGDTNVALGAVEYVAVTKDAAARALLDSFLDRIDGEPDFVIDTVESARRALLDVEATRLLGEDRSAKAIAHDDAIRARTFGDFAEPVTHTTARAYALAPDRPSLSNTANVAMLILKARLFRLTKDETFCLEARAIYAALQVFRISAGRYSSGDAREALKTDARDVIVLDDEAELAFATALLFEITGEDRFITETDAIFDAVATLRGPSGLAHHAIDGTRDSAPCTTCAFHALQVLGYRRSLAGEAW